MRREHNEIKSNPLMDFLQAHNAIFYSPLSKTDTTDWISGNAMQLYSANSAVWDNTNNIWKFQYANNPTGSTLGYYAKWHLSEDAVMSPFILTAIAELYCYGNTDNGAVNCYNLSNNTSGSGLVMFGIKDRLTYSCQRFDIQNNVSVQDQIMDSNIVFSYTYTQILNLQNMLYVDIAWDMRYNQEHRRGPFGIRNFACFSSTLSLDEINEYFNIVTL